MNRYFFAGICSLVIFSSCHFFGGEHIRGDGVIKKEDRTANRQFSSVEVSNAFELHIRQDQAYSVTIEADENLLHYVIVENDGDKLKIYSEKNYNLDPTNGDRVKIWVSSPVLNNLQASGACNIVGENLLSSGQMLSIDLSGASNASLELKAPKVSVELSGASGVNIKGETKDLTVEGSGASHARCFDLLSENTDVDMSGASSAEVFGSVKINGTASGASTIKCKGKGSLTKDESGASNVEKIE